MNHNESQPQITLDQKVAKCLQQLSPVLLELVKRVELSKPICSTYQSGEHIIINLTCYENVNIFTDNPIYNRGHVTQIIPQTNSDDVDTSSESETQEQPAASTGVSPDVSPVVSPGVSTGVSNAASTTVFAGVSPVVSTGVSPVVSTGVSAVVSTVKPMVKMRVKMKTIQYASFDYVVPQPRGWDIKKRTIYGGVLKKQRNLYSDQYMLTRIVEMIKMR